MLLPASYLNGFAPRDGQPLYPSLWKGCCGAWNPGLGPSGLVLRDNSGFKNNGTLTNGPTFAASQGKYAMSFDGVNDYVIIPDSNSLDITNTFTISFWFKPLVLNQTNTYLISKPKTTNDDDNSFSVIWEYVDNTVEFYSGDFTGTNPRTGSGISVTDTNMHHIAYSSTGNTWSGYKDGINVFSVARVFSLVASTKSLFFGNINASFGAFSNVQLDDVRIYNRALSPDEIRTLSTRRGIAYEMAPRRRSSSAVAVTSYSTFRPSVLRGSR